MAGKEEKETIVMEGCAILLLGVLTILVGLNNHNIVVVEAAPQGARVTSLPGFSGPFASVHYAGYVTVDKEHGRSLYYYFVTSENNPVSDPLVLWFNGGPACSSFYGFVFEHGPFNFIPGNGSIAMPTLVENPYTWAKVANVLYVESPAGVGFSYSNNTNDYHTGDIKTASDAHAFLLKDEFTKALHQTISTIDKSSDEYEFQYQATFKAVEMSFIYKGKRLAAIANPSNGEDFFQIIFNLAWDTKGLVVTEDKLQSLATSSVGPGRKRYFVPLRMTKTREILGACPRITRDSASIWLKKPIGGRWCLKQTPSSVA